MLLSFMVGTRQGIEISERMCTMNMLQPISSRADVEKHECLLKK
jgi:hypothetical protein